MQAPVDRRFVEVPVSIPPHERETHAGRSGPADTFGLAGRRVVRFGVVYAATVAILNVLALAGYAAIRGGAADPAQVGTQASVLLGGLVVGLILLICGLSLLISTVVWIVSAHRLRPAGPGLTGYGGLAVCVLLTALGSVLPGQVSSVNAAAAVESALRIGGAVALVAGVLLTRAGIRRETGHPIPAPGRTLITSDDWDASKWDPQVQRDIDRRRGADPTV
jgi:hypothetical protein